MTDILGLDSAKSSLWNEDCRQVSPLPLHVPASV